MQRQDGGHAPTCGERARPCGPIREKPIFRAPQRGAGLIVAATTNPRLLESLRARFQAWQQAIARDGIDPVRATVVRLAADGL